MDKLKHKNNKPENQHQHSGVKRQDGKLKTHKQPFLRSIKLIVNQATPSLQICLISFTGIPFPLITESPNTWKCKQIIWFSSTGSTETVKKDACLHACTKTCCEASTEVNSKKSHSILRIQFCSKSSLVGTRPQLQVQFFAEVLPS